MLCCILSNPSFIIFVCHQFMQLDVDIQKIVKNRKKKNHSLFCCGFFLYISEKLFKK